MTSNKLQSSFFIPYVWDKNADLMDSLKLLKTLEKDQINIIDFNVNHSKETICNRQQTAEWILFVCKNLNLKNETTFKAVHYFDLYLSKTKKIYDDIEEMNYLAVVCLNLACKVEEINCNYLNYLMNNLLDETKHSKEKFIKKEQEVLAVLKYKLSMPNFYTFNNIFLQIAVNIILEEKLEVKLIKHMMNINDLISKNFVPLKESVFSSPINTGLVCFKTTILALNYLCGSGNEVLVNGLDKKLKFIFSEEYLKRCSIVAFNLFGYLNSRNKFNLGLKKE
jgi:hypothetical protein